MLWTESKDKLALGYWDIQGRAHPVRWLLAYYRIGWEDKQYKDRSEWYDKDKPALSSDFPNLPYIKDGDLVITETFAVLHAIKTGNKDLFGKNTLDAIKLSQLSSFIGDARNILKDLFLTKNLKRSKMTF